MKMIMKWQTIIFTCVNLWLSVSHKASWPFLPLINGDHCFSWNFIVVMFFHRFGLRSSVDFWWSLPGWIWCYRMQHPYNEKWYRQEIKIEYMLLMTYILRRVQTSKAPPANMKGDSAQWCFAILVEARVPRQEGFVDRLQSFFSRFFLNFTEWYRMHMTSGHPEGKLLDNLQHHGRKPRTDPGSSLLSLTTRQASMLR